MLNLQKRGIGHCGRYSECGGSSMLNVPVGRGVSGGADAADLRLIGAVGLRGVCAVRALLRGGGADARSLLK